MKIFSISKLVDNKPETSNIFRFIVDFLKQPEKKNEIETEMERERRQNKKRRAGLSGPWDACEC